MGFPFDPILGRLTDVATAAGTAMARLKYLIDILAPKYGMLTTIAHAAINQATTVSGTLYTICDISGSGYLYRASLFTSAGNSLSTIKVTIDGNAYTLSPPAALNHAMGFGSKFFSSASSSVLAEDFIGPVKFLTSLKVEVAHASTTQLQGYAQWGIDR